MELVCLGTHFGNSHPQGLLPHVLSALALAISHTVPSLLLVPAPDFPIIILAALMTPALKL